MHNPLGRRSLPPADAPPPRRASFRSLLNIPLVIALLGSACADEDRPNCPPSQSLCGDVCVDLGFEDEHCGTCGNVCPIGTTCSEQLCVSVCPDGTGFCDGVCRDLGSDPNHCGVCGTVCEDGEVCSAGTCARSCGPDLELCGERCRDVEADPGHCGSCSRACALGEVCSAGECTLSCQAGLTDCGGACRDTETDRAHCGACGNICAPGEVCSGGTCALSCQAGLTECSGSCRDTRSNRAHCGACGSRCEDGEVCSNGACALSCQASLTDCGGSCRDLQSDRAHCGACGTVCSDGDVCSNGTCQRSCEPGFNECGGSCRDIQSDRAHCGACGNSCAAGEVCSSGVCQLSCETSLTECGGSCRDIQSDRAHCGACGNTCSAGEVCSNGSCQLSCETGLTDCGGSCRDLQLDRAHCGTCGNACPTGEVCSSGSCQLSCETGLSDCGGSCRDAQSDRGHCGACGNACAAGEICTAGACALSCQAGFSDCGGSCRDTQSDLNHCGACGNACSAGEVCSAGTCALSCQSGLTECSGTCRDTQTDLNHCGTCGNVCPSGNTCEGGACVLSCPNGFTDCSGQCVDVSASPAHCGACGNACGAGQACQSSSCRDVFCGPNERVQSSVCTACPAGTTNAAGDSAAGPDTSCDDPCFVVLGVSCSDFEQAYVKGSNTERSDQFGGSVAISGNTMVVGARFEDGLGNSQGNGANASGAAYVFVRTSTVWTQQAYLKPSNSGSNDRFGASVDIDGETIVVSAIAEASNATGVNGDQFNNSAFDAGAVYVFTRSGSTWSQEAYIKASNTDTSDNFGNALSLSGDTLAVGARLEDSNAVGINGNQADNSALEAGAVYVYVRNAGAWSQQAYVKASNAEAGDQFGRQLSLDGDTLVVGAPEERGGGQGVGANQADNSLRGAGAAYVFTRANGVWSQQAYLKASNTGTDRFGTSVGVSGDTVAVGANFESSRATGVDGDQSDNSIAFSGAVYVFARSSGAWSQQAYLKASNTDFGDQFGLALSLDGDRLAVGASSEDSGATGLNGDQSDNTVSSAGAVYLFERSGSTWSQRAYLKASNSGRSDGFGTLLSLDAESLVIGAPSEASSATGINGDQSDNSASSAGAAYVRRIAP